MCVWAKEQAKSFHKIPPALRFWLTAGGLRRCNVCFHHLRVFLRVRVRSKMSKNHSSCCPVLLTGGGDRHFFTDTLCSHTPMLIFLLCPEFPENQICAPQKSDFSGKKIFSSNLTNPQLLKWLTVSVWRREAYWQSRLS